MDAMAPHTVLPNVLVISGRKQLVRALQETVSSDYLHAPAPWIRVLHSGPAASLLL